MADSDNSTTLPSVMHGRGGRPTAIEPDCSDGADPVLALRRDWLRAQYVAQILCRFQQRLETRMMVNTGIPVLTAGRAISAFSGPTEESAARTDLTAEHAIACEAEVFAMTGALKLQDAIPETTALSLAGVVAKLEIIVGSDRDIDDPTDFPWPHIASVLIDLKKIAGSPPMERPDRAAVQADCARYRALAADLIGLENRAAESAVG